MKVYDIKIGHIEIFYRNNRINPSKYRGRRDTYYRNSVPRELFLTMLRNICTPNCNLVALCDKFSAE